MKWKVKKASDWKYEEFIEINTIEELQALSKRFDDKSLVVDFRDFRIVIYDDYLE